MAFTDYASNGYLLLDNSTQLQTLEITYKTSRPTKIVKSTAGQAGAALGRPEVALQVKCAVPKLARERKAVIEKYQRGDTVTMTYRTANGEMKADGKISSCDLASKVDDADEFSYDFVGIEEPIREV